MLNDNSKKRRDTKLTVRFLANGPFKYILPIESKLGQSFAATYRRIPFNIIKWLDVLKLTKRR